MKMISSATEKWKKKEFFTRNSKRISNERVGWFWCLYAGLICGDNAVDLYEIQSTTNVIVVFHSWESIECVWPHANNIFSQKFALCDK